MREETPFKNNAVTVNQDLISKIISVIDLTSLNETDNSDVIQKLCLKALNAPEKVAAICVYPRFVKQVSDTVSAKFIKVATVVNFPEGKEDIEKNTQQIILALEVGADEIDVVFPYQQFLLGDNKNVFVFIEKCKLACGKKTLKVILESGAFPSQDLLAEASRGCILSGADFLKTSTGKIPMGATVGAAHTMLSAIKELQAQMNHTLGFKASGGIKTIEQAITYINLAENILGKGWVTPKTFRIGASQLLDVALESR